MWQSPNQPGGPPAGKKRRKSKRLFHVKRMDVLCEFLGVSTGASDAPSQEGETTKPVQTIVRFVLNDLSIKGAGFFSSIQMTPGQEIRLTLPDPKKVVIIAKVAWCQGYNLNSHIISKDPFLFSVGVEFVIPTSADAESLQALIDELKAEHLVQK
jgi:hypothetical protein